MQDRTISELEQDIVDALNKKVLEAIEFLGIKEDKEPITIVKKIRKKVDDLLSNENILSEDIDEYALMLGALWGKAVVDRYGWKYKYVTFEDKSGGIYLVSPNEYFCCPPLFFLNNILIGKNIGFDGNNDNTTELLFNMLDDIEDQKSDKKLQVVC